MAKKEALRQLQQRLALRMQQARDEPRAAAWLAVQVAGQGLLLPLAQAGEIFDLPAVVAVPHTRAWFVGVANLRGGLHAVVDFGAFLGLPAQAAGAGRDHARLVALNTTLGLNCALLVDKLAGLRQRDELQALPEEAGERPAFAGARWRDAGGAVWQEIDLSALAADAHFLAVAG